MKKFLLWFARLFFTVMILWLTVIAWQLSAVLGFIISLTLVIAIGYYIGEKYA